MDSINNVIERNEEEEQKLKQLESDLIRDLFTFRMEYALKLHGKNLCGEADIDRLIKCDEKLTTALHNNMFILPANGVKFDIKTLNEQIKRSEYFCGIIHSAVSDQQINKMVGMSSSLTALNSALENQMSEMAKVRELLLAITMLESVERSLKIQLLQSENYTDL